MQLPICAFVTWLTIILFALVPKRLSTLEFVFLYCVILSLAATSYTFFELNWQSVTIPRIGTSVAAAVICRLIAVPFLIMTAVNALQPSERRKPQWLVAVVIWLGLTAFEWILNRYNVVSYNFSMTWHVVSSLITHLGFIAVPWGIMWWYKRLDLRKERPI